MAPFIVLIALFGFFYLLGSVWLPAQFDWLTSLRLALAGMFLLTASAHWGKQRQDLRKTHKLDGERALGHTSNGTDHFTGVLQENEQFVFTRSR